MTVSKIVLNTLVSAVLNNYDTISMIQAYEYLYGKDYANDLRKEVYQRIISLKGKKHVFTI